MGRGSVWHPVWDDRDDDRADWNGFESCFESMDDYERWTRHIGAMLRSELALATNDTVADLGCGTGRFAELVATYVQKVLAFDYGAAPIRVAVAKRQFPNVSYQVADVTTLQPEALGISKAYAVSSLQYLDSVETAFTLIRSFVASGASFGAIDLADRRATHVRNRSYDTTVYSHLGFDADELVAEFPGTRIVWDDFSGYANGPFRFHAFIPAGGESPILPMEPLTREKRD